MKQTRETLLMNENEELKRRITDIETEYLRFCTLNRLTREQLNTLLSFAGGLRVVGEAIQDVKTQLCDGGSI